MEPSGKQQKVMHESYYTHKKQIKEKQLIFCFSVLMFSALATKLTNTELKDIGKTNLKEKVCYKATKLIGALFLQVK
jgi:hypothetical protein